MCRSPSHDTTKYDQAERWRGRVRQVHVQGDGALLEEGPGAELIKEYGHLLPALADVPAGDDDPAVIGCIAEPPIGIMLACAAAAVGNQKYHEHFEMQCEADGEQLPVDHIRLLMGLAADGVPFKTMRIDGIVEVSAFCSNLLGLSNSPECQ